MHEKNTRPNVGQDNIDSSVNANVYILKEFPVLRRHLEHFLSGLTSMCERLRARIVGEGERATNVEPGTPRVPSIATTNDGRVLLSLHYAEGADLSDREKWTGLFLTEEERCDVLGAVANGADDAAAHVGGRLIAKGKKGEPEESGGNGR